MVLINPKSALYTLQKLALYTLTELLVKLIWPSPVNPQFDLSPLCAYPEWWVGDLDPSPGDGDGVFTGFLGHVFTQEGPVLLILDLHGDGLEVDVQTADLQGGFAGLLGIHCEFCPLVQDHTCLLQTGTIGCHLNNAIKYCTNLTNAECPSESTHYCINAILNSYLTLSIIVIVMFLIYDLEGITSLGLLTLKVLRTLVYIEGNACLELII